MAIGSENAGMVTEKGKFLYVSKRDVSNKSILYQVCKCWVCKTWSGVKDILNENGSSNARQMQIIQWAVSWNCGKVFLYWWYNRS